MADDGDFIGIGSTVFCKNCFEEEITGEVIAFERQTKFLVLSILLFFQMNRIIVRRFRLPCRISLVYVVIYFVFFIVLHDCSILSYKCLILSSGVNFFP